LKKLVAFRPPVWLSFDLESYAKTHGLIDQTNEKYPFTETLLNYIRELKSRVPTAEQNAKDAAIWKAQYERLAKDLKPWRCERFGESVNILQCYACQDQCKKEPQSVPTEIRECTRNRKVT